jgi:hypothetical protein
MDETTNERPPLRTRVVFAEDREEYPPYTREFPVFGVANYCALMLDELKKLEPRKDLLSQRDFFAPLKNEPEEK